MNLFFICIVFALVLCHGSQVKSLLHTLLITLSVNMAEGDSLKMGSLEEQIEELRAQLSSQRCAAHQLAILQEENEFIRQKNERMEKELSNTKCFF